jgi:hypothetical protein
LERKKKMFTMEKERGVSFEIAMMACTSEAALQSEDGGPSAVELELTRSIVEVALDDDAAVPSGLIERIREVDVLFAGSKVKCHDDPDPELRTADGESDCQVPSPPHQHLLPARHPLYLGSMPLWAKSSQPGSTCVHVDEKGMCQCGTPLNSTRACLSSDHT